jgi:ADP-ribose pyrophosphatase
MTEPGILVADWEVLNTTPVLEHSFVTVAMEEVRLPDGQVIPDWPKILTHDYVNAVVVNKNKEALILEGYKHGAGRIIWQIVGGYLEPGEDPLTAVQRELLEETGYSTKDWSYLGSFVVDPNRHIGIGHFFCAQNIEPTSQPIQNPDLEAYELKLIHAACG